MAGLPASRAWVSVLPLLSASGPSCGLVPVWLPVASPAMVQPCEVSVPEQSGRLVPELLSALPRSPCGSAQSSLRDLLITLLFAHVIGKLFRTQMRSLMRR